MDTGNDLFGPNDVTLRGVLKLVLGANSAGAGCTVLPPDTVADLCRRDWIIESDTFAVGAWLTHEGAAALLAMSNVEGRPC